ncbi:restriction endonuclease subunit S [Puia dinghuensis]|uniref:Type I restriction modification DNA specificity domain-containing protein n=1 Tax=Puia dinghuensis TaxID=1792502 RepID=A0A8J2UJ08_9BACT|nr:restriction endonuclease subunit S [Puia dinghuensis]GGB24815.1 hypothetical protein GCM10011511_55930 [Puia dinghuensis]
MLKISLSEIAEIRFGLHALPGSWGPISYLQVRHFSEDGLRIPGSEEYLPLTTKNKSHVLLDGDVLFVGKGSRLFSWCYTKSEQPVIASSIFFVLRPDVKVVYPEYLSTILNAPQSKTLFLQLGSGTNIFSIRKSELGAFEIPIPPLAQQKRIATLARLHQQETALARQLIAEKQNMYTSIISKLIK